jgi:hypothetical protein
VQGPYHNGGDDLRPNRRLRRAGAGCYRQARSSFPSVGYRKRKHKQLASSCQTFLNKTREYWRVQNLKKDHQPKCQTESISQTGDLRHVCCQAVVAEALDIKSSRQVEDCFLSEGPTIADRRKAPPKVLLRSPYTRSNSPLPPASGGRTLARDHDGSRREH